VLDLVPHRSFDEGLLEIVGMKFLQACKKVCSSKSNPNLGFFEGDPTSGKMAG